MWLTLAFTSAALLGFYDAAKKKALTDNAVLPVLLLNTLFSTLIFLPAILSAEFGLGWFDHTVLATARRRAADLRRASQRLPVDRRCAGSRVALSAEPFEPPRRGRLHS